MVARIADVIVVWNVLEHFWPYWNVVSADWTAELDAALADALDERSTASPRSTPAYVQYSSP